MRNRNINNLVLIISNRVVQMIFQSMRGTTSPELVRVTIQHSKYTIRQNSYNKIIIAFKNDKIISKSINLYALGILQEFKNYEWRVYSQSLEIIQKPHIKEISSLTQQQIITILMQRADSVFKRMAKVVVSNKAMDEDFKLLFLTQFNGVLDQEAIIGIKVIRNETNKYRPGDTLVYYLKPLQQEQIKQIKKSINQFQQHIEEIVYMSLEDITQSIADKGKESFLKELLKINQNDIISMGHKFGFIVNNIGIYRKQIEPESELEIEEILRQEIEEQQESEASLVQQSELNIIKRDETRQVRQTDKRQWVLGLKLTGFRRNFMEFYLYIDMKFKRLPFKILKIHQIRSRQLNDLPKFIQEPRMSLIDYNTLLIIKPSPKTKKFIGNELKLCKKMIIKSQLPEHAMDFLVKQHQTKRLRDYLENKGVVYEKIQINPQRLIIRSTPQNYQKFFKEASHLLQINKQQKQIECKILKDELEIHSFLRYYKQNIVSSYYTSFKVKDNRLYFDCFEQYQKEIMERIKQKRDQLINRFCWVPSLKPISPYKAKKNKILNTYYQVSNPKCLNEPILKSAKLRINQNCYLLVAPFTGFLQYQKELILVISTDIDKDSQVLKYMHQHIFFEDPSPDVNHLRVPSQFIMQCKGNLPERIKMNSLQNHKGCKSFILFYVDIKQPNYRHIERDLQLILKSQQYSTTLKFLFPKSAKRVIEEMFPKFIMKIKQLTNTLEIALSNIQIYLEDYEHERKIVENYAINKSGTQVTLLTKHYFTIDSLIKINSLHYYKIFYYHNEVTHQVNGVSAYFFNFQIQRKNSLVSQQKKQKSLITLFETEEQKAKFGDNPILIDFRQKVIYFFYAFCKVVKVRFPIKEERPYLSSKIKIAKELLTFIQVIKNYFGNLEFFVTYGTQIQESDIDRNNELILGKDLCLNLYYTSTKNINAQIENTPVKLAPFQRIEYDQGYQKIRKRDDYIKITNAVMKRQRYDEWFMIQVNQPGINDVLNSLED